MPQSAFFPLMVSMSICLPGEPCCGALAQHANDPESAIHFVRNLVEILAGRSEDFFVSPIAGCGAQLKTLDHLLAESGGLTDAARSVVSKVRDITELLDQSGLRPGLRPPSTAPLPITIRAIFCMPSHRRSAAPTIEPNSRPQNCSVTPIRFLL